MKKLLLLITIAFALSACSTLQEKLTTRGKKKEAAKEVAVEPVVPAGDKSRVPIVPLSEAQQKEADAAKKEYERALKAMKNGKNQEAMVLFQSIAARYPSLAGPWINQGIIHLRKEEFDEAAEKLRKAVSIYPNHAYAHNLLGVALREQGQFKDAKASYLKAISIDKNYANAHYNLAVLADLYLQDLPLALEHFRTFQSLQDEPDQQVEGWIKDLTRRTQSSLNPLPQKKSAGNNTPAKNLSHFWQLHPNFQTRSV